MLEDDLDPDARAHSDRLAELIRDQILSNGGALPFWRFMELALYAPGLGYYSAGATKLGPSGDFVTAPELGPLFAECVAAALAPVLARLGDDSVFLEIGGGSGAFAEAVIPRLIALRAMPARYAILEPSADLRQRQRERLRTVFAPDVYERVEWLQSPIQPRWNGVVFANEVLDALPHSRFVIRDGEVYEEHVAYERARGFHCVDRPADALLSAAVRHLERQCATSFEDGFRSEVLPQLPYWLQAVVGGLDAGALLFVDYGYPRREYYDPRRADGTLRAFHRHRMVDNVFARVGLQDVTVSVDFTALAEAGVASGFEFAGYCSQASFLIGNGLDQRLAQHEARAVDEAARHACRQEVKKLTLPGEMGERFQAMGFVRKTDLAHAFLVGDLSHRL
ncbi:MAG: class I SAM-dependent methyltransferase [Lysobacteraceae bacterium]|nr:MAG: class I SAM-dependent methyltransferase [Xanthomonadaceae bacterium]